MFYLYIIQSISKDILYVGSTNDLRRRVKEHNSGCSSFTKKHLPWKLVYYEAYCSEKDARIREQKLKYHGKGLAEVKKRIQYSLDKTL